MGGYANNAKLVCKWVEKALVPCVNNGKYVNM